MLGAVVVGAELLLAGQRKHQRRADTTEARVGVRALCAGVVAEHQGSGAWLEAGPAPVEMPRAEAVEFPRLPAFERLAFWPGRVRYQYQVVVERPDGGPVSAHCIARGDLDGDGETSRFELVVDEGLRPGEVRAVNELE